MEANKSNKKHIFFSNQLDSRSLVNKILTLEIKIPTSLLYTELFIRLKLKLPLKLKKGTEIEFIMKKEAIDSTSYEM